MVVKINLDRVQVKLEELCADLLEQEEYKELRQTVDQFTADEKAIQRYEQFMELHESLQLKEQNGQELTPMEIGHYEQEEQRVYENSVIRKFLYAQGRFSDLHSWVSQYVMKTIELNRLPKPQELKKVKGCGCGGACGGEH